MRIGKIRRKKRRPKPALEIKEEAPPRLIYNYRLMSLSTPPGSIDGHGLLAVAPGGHDMMDGSRGRRLDSTRHRAAGQAGPPDDETIFRS